MAPPRGCVGIMASDPNLTVRCGHSRYEFSRHSHFFLNRVPLPLADYCIVRAAARLRSPRLPLWMQSHAFCLYYGTKHLLILCHHQKIGDRLRLESSWIPNTLSCVDADRLTLHKVELPDGEDLKQLVPQFIQGVLRVS
jgi:hypothetical protein